ncbi:MAG: hypothetical protein Q9192_005936, partial [Flavoplaca navasiana]
DDRILQYNITTNPKTPNGAIHISATIQIHNLARQIRGSGSDIPTAISSALAVGTGLQIGFEIFERKWTEGGRTRRMAVAMCSAKKGAYVSWGVNMSSEFREAELLACLSAALVSAATLVLIG